MMCWGRILKNQTVYSSLWVGLGKLPHLVGPSSHTISSFSLKTLREVPWISFGVWESAVGSNPKRSSRYYVKGKVVGRRRGLKS